LVYESNPEKILTSPSNAAHLWIALWQKRRVKLQPTIAVGIVPVSAVVTRAPTWASAALGRVEKCRHPKPRVKAKLSLSGRNYFITMCHQAGVNCKNVTEVTFRDILLTGTLKPKSNFRFIRERPFAIPSFHQNCPPPLSGPWWWLGSTKASALFKICPAHVTLFTSVWVRPTKKANDVLEVQAHFFKNSAIILKLIWPDPKKQTCVYRNT